MSLGVITQDDAEKLIKMIKHSLTDRIAFPESGNTKEFDVAGDNKNDVFTISIYKSRINPVKYNFGARVKLNGTMLLELHINPNTIHINPDGEKIKGNHWHIYKEGFGRSYAFIADNIEDEMFVKNTLLFLDEFNVIKKPCVVQQIGIFPRNDN